MCDLLVDRKFIRYWIKHSPPPNLCLKAEIKTTPLILQTTKEGRNFQFFFSLHEKPILVCFCRDVTHKRRLFCQFEVWSTLTNENKQNYLKYLYLKIYTHKRKLHTYDMRAFKYNYRCVCNATMNTITDWCVKFVFQTRAFFKC